MDERSQLAVFNKTISENYNIEIEDFMEAYFVFCKLPQEDKNVALKWFEVGNQGIGLTDKLKDFNAKLKLKLDIDIDEFLDTYLYFTELSNDTRTLIIKENIKKESTEW